MIEVFFEYERKDGSTSYGSTNFVDVVKALRFIKKIKKSEKYFYKGYICQDSEDNEYLWYRI